MYDTTFTMKSYSIRDGAVRVIETELHPDLTVHPDGSIYNVDVNGVEWKINWWEVQDVQVELAAEGSNPGVS